jgi:hypothetical protein
VRTMEPIQTAIARGKRSDTSCTGVSINSGRRKNLYEGALPAFHLMEQPMLGC